MLRKLVFSLLVVVLAGAAWIGSASAGQDKVTICHKPGTPDQATLQVAAPAKDAHLAHGDYEGECRGPESAGCAALNAIVPDPQTLPDSYSFVVSDLDFDPGETIHADITVTVVSASDGALQTGVIDSTPALLAIQFVDLPRDQPGQYTASVDYTVVAGDDADGVFVSGGGIGSDTFTVDAVHFSCTPAH